MNDKIHVVHIGGRHGIGPVNRVCSFAPSMVHLTVVEAFLEQGELALHEKQKKAVASCDYLEACVAQKRKKTLFHVAKQPMASGLYPMAKSSDDYTFFAKKRVHKWRDHCTTAKSIPVETVPLDELPFKFPVDVLSMDIQGAEYEVMLGGSKTLGGPVVAMVSEFEMIPLYEGQGLLEDQLRLLRGYGFMFFDILKSGKWHWHEVKGQGALMWGEALWIRSIDSLLKMPHSDSDKALSLVKLASVCLSYDRESYAYEAIEQAIKKFPKQMKDLYNRQPSLLGMIAKTYDTRSDRPTKIKDIL